MAFDPVGKARKQHALKVSRPAHLFLSQVPLEAQNGMLGGKPLAGIHSWGAMVGVMLLRNGDVNLSPFIPTSVFHQPAVTLPNIKSGGHL